MNITISKRLLTVAGMVPAAKCIADIGTDHGYIPIYMVSEGKALTALAMDINRGPLEKARLNIQRFGLSDKIKTRLSDGLSAYQPGEADVLVIAGMGGALIQRILLAGMHKIKEVTVSPPPYGRRETAFVFQPQSEIGLFRHFLHKQGFCILDETMIIDEGKYYTVISAAFGQEQYDHEAEYAYGRILIQKQQPEFVAYLAHEFTLKDSLRKQLLTVTSETGIQRRQALEAELKLLKEAQSL